MPYPQPPSISDSTTRTGRQMRVTPNSVPGTMPAGQSRMRALIEIGQTGSHCQDAGQRLQRAADLVTMELQLTGATIYQFEKNDHLLRPLVTTTQSHRDDVLSFPLELGEGLTGSVAATGQARIINHADTSNEAIEIPGTLQVPESIMAAPMICDGEVLGVILASVEGQATFTEDDLEWLKIYACPITLIVRELGLTKEFTAERQLLREQLIRAEKMRVLGEMASGVFHDINNILGAVLGRVELMQHRTGDEELKKSLSQVDKIALQGAATVKRLQEFSRSHQATEFRDTDLNQVIDDALEITRHRWESQAQQKGFTYKITREFQSSVQVNGIHPQLVDAVANLLLNAIDAMPQGGELTFRTELTAQGCRLSVRDTGAGMSPEQVDRVFTPFYTTKGVRGTGLGLSVVRDIVERHQGQVQVESKVGAGTVFHIDLPCVSSQSTGVATPAANDEPKGLRLILVDDDHTILDVVSEALQDAGHKVDVFDNGADAITAIGKSTYDVVITDLGMPEVTGWDVARAAKIHQPKLPVLVISGWGAQYDGGHLGDTGVDAVLAKPFHLKQLRETVEELSKAHV